jgi:urease accessory protein
MDAVPEPAVLIPAASITSAALLLADSRFPAGGHAHSGGLEAAVTAGTVRDLATLGLFLRGRLRTAGLLAAGLAAAACEQTLPWAELHAEADARTPSPAQREASRRQGRALLRAARTAWPEVPWDDLGKAPHHAVVLGAAAKAAGCTPPDAALIAAYQSVAGPASAAVRLLAMDPLQVSALLAGLTAEIEDIALQAAMAGDLPCSSAPALDLLAEAHARSEVRLFVS